MDLNNYLQGVRNIQGEKSRLQEASENHFADASKFAQNQDEVGAINEKNATQGINQAFNMINEGIVGKALTGKGSQFLTKSMAKGINNKLLKPAGGRIVDYMKGEASFSDDMKNLPGRLNDGADRLGTQIDEFGQKYSKGAIKYGQKLGQQVEDLGSKAEDFGKGAGQIAEKVFGDFKAGLSKAQSVVDRGTGFIRNQAELNRPNVGSMNGDPDAAGHVVSSLDDDAIGAEPEFGLSNPEGLELKDPSSWNVNSEAGAGNTAGAPGDAVGSAEAAGQDAGVVEEAAQGASATAADATEAAEVAARSVGGLAKGAARVANRADADTIDALREATGAARNPVDMLQRAGREGDQVLDPLREAASANSKDIASQAAKDAASAASDAADAADSVANAANVGVDAGIDTVDAALVATDVADAAVPGLDILTDAATLAFAGAGFGFEKLADYIEKKTSGPTDTAKAVVRQVITGSSAAGQLMSSQT